MRVVAIRHKAVVGLAVAAAVEAVAYGTSRGRLDGTSAAQGSEGRFCGHAFGVVTGGDEQGGGSVGTDSRGAEECWVGLGAEMADLFVEFCDFCGERLVSAGQDAQGLSGVGGGGLGGSGSETGACFDLCLGGESMELLFDLLGSGYH